MNVYVMTVERKVDGRVVKVVVGVFSTSEAAETYWTWLQSTDSCLTGTWGYSSFTVDEPSYD